LGSLGESEEIESGSRGVEESRSLRVEESRERVGWALPTSDSVRRDATEAEAFGMYQGLKPLAIIMASRCDGKGAAERQRKVARPFKAG